MSRRIWSAIASAMILALTLTACGGKAAAPATEPTVAPGKQAQAAPTAAAKPAAAPTATEAPKPTETSAPEEADLALQSRDTGLDRLTSYRATWHAEWKSTKEGQTETGMWDWNEEYTTQPIKARHLIWRATDSNDPTKINTFETWQVGDTMYMKTSDDKQCIAISSEETAKNLEQGLFSPNSLGAIQNGKYLGKETVNGIPTKHYKYDAQGFITTGGEATGESWVAVDGGYIVKDAVTWKGGAGFLGLGSGDNGEGSWVWQITDANKSFEITPPAECTAQASGMDLPVMPDATEKTRFGGMLSYKTASKPADVAAFYGAELPKAGWAAEGEPTEAGDVTMINYKKDAQTLSLMITASEGVTQVILNLGE